VQQFDAVVEAGPGDALPPPLEHRLADVDSDDLRLCRAGKGDGDAGGSRRDVEDSSRLETSDVSHQLAAPGAVLTEGQHLGQAVVARRQVLEKTRRDGVLRARGRRAGISHTRHQRTVSRSGLMG
jgi:hypothetical protein